MRRVWAWLVAALGTVVLALALLWRRATRQRNEARDQRDAARRSADRERQVATESEAVREVVRGKRLEVETTLREEVARIEAKVRPTSKDELVTELNKRLAERRKNGTVP